MNMEAAFRCCCRDLHKPGDDVIAVGFRHSGPVKERQVDMLAQTKQSQIVVGTVRGAAFHEFNGRISPFRNRKPDT